MGSLEEIEPQWESPQQQATVAERYASIVLSQDEYEQAKAHFCASKSSSPEPTVLSENRAAWRRVEARLCQEIDRQVSAQGLRLATLELKHGPDYTAASAELRATGSALRSIIRRGPSSMRGYLQIDRLADDVWYARSSPHPFHPMSHQVL